MAQAQARVTTVRVPNGLRSRLKTLAASREQTMEAAMAEALELWANGGAAARGGRRSRECQRMRAQVDEICGRGNARVIGAVVVVLDGLVLLK